MEALCSLGRSHESIDILEQYMNLSSTNEDIFIFHSIPKSWSADGASFTNTSSIAKVVATVNKGMILVLQHRLEDAKIELSKALEICPKFLPAIQGLVYILLRQKKHVDAMKILRTLTI